MPVVPFLRQHNHMHPFPIVTILTKFESSLERHWDILTILVTGDKAIKARVQYMFLAMVSFSCHMATLDGHVAIFDNKIVKL